MCDKVQAYLKKIDQVIEAGPYRADWASLNEYPVPEWYKRQNSAFLFIGEFTAFPPLAANGTPG